MCDFQLTMTPYTYKSSHTFKHSVVEVAFFRHGPMDPWKVPLYSTDVTLQIFSCLFIEGPSESAQKTPRHQILSTKRCIYHHLQKRGCLWIVQRQQVALQKGFKEEKGKFVLAWVGKSWLGLLVSNVVWSKLQSNDEFWLLDFSFWIVEPWWSAPGMS